ncbi:MAG TPA: FAD-dependent oxidoreductase [Candidatus Paceibacterota bacterium]|jgi:ferredoxin-NADP reductase|nr:FAD-dependent oxidoreductase [Candidatus Paceibacterota bacterium]
MKYTTELISKETVAEGTMAFHMKKPEGFVFLPGQNCDFTIVNPPETDAEGNIRTFSITSSPSESEIAIATRMRDTAFKRTLKNAEPGLQIQFDGPMGSFTLHEKASRPAIILVGGIGITPFMSIVKDAAERALPHKIYMFYSNRRPEDTAFLTVLQDLAKKNPNFAFVPTMTEMEKSGGTWDGERGYIDMAMIDRHVSDKNDAIYYMAGPQGMVAAMRKMLNDSGISNDDIKTEEFSGY